MENGNELSSPVAAAQKHQSVRRLCEHPEGNASHQVAHVGSMEEAFGGCREEEQHSQLVHLCGNSQPASVSVPRVSPMVTMAFCRTAQSPVSLESMTAKWGFQSPHFSFAQHWEQTITGEMWNKTTGTVTVQVRRVPRSGRFTVAAAGTLPDSSWKTVCRGSLAVSWPVNLPKEQRKPLHVSNGGFVSRWPHGASVKKEEHSCLLLRRYTPG